MQSVRTPLVLVASVLRGVFFLATDLDSRFRAAKVLSAAARSPLTPFPSILRIFRPSYSHLSNFLEDISASRSLFVEVFGGFESF